MITKNKESLANCADTCSCFLSDLLQKHCVDTVSDETHC